MEDNQERIDQLNIQINSKTIELDKIKKELGTAKFNNPIKQNDINKKQEWFDLHSYIMDLMERRDSLKS